MHFSFITLHLPHSVCDSKRNGEVAFLFFIQLQNTLALKTSVFFPFPQSTPSAKQMEWIGVNKF